MIRPISQARQTVRDFGTCLSFVNATDIIQMGTSNPFTGSFYFSAWLKWSGLNGAYQSIFAKRTSYASNDMMFDFNLIDTTGFITMDSITSYVIFGVKLPTIKWTHLTWVHDTSGAKDKLYINAELVSNQNIGALGIGTSAPITIGGDQNPGQQNFNGLIDEVSIGTYAPTQAQVDNIFYRSVYASNNVWAILKLDEGSGSTATDSSGSGNDGTITGATYVTNKVLTTRTASGTRFSLPKSTQKSIKLDGASNLTSPITPDTTGFDLALWWKASSKLQDHGIVNWESAANRNGFNLKQDGTTSVISLIGSGTAGTVLSLTSTTNIVPNKWNHIAMTYNSSGVAKVYINSVQNLIGTATITSNGFALTVGKRSYDASLYANGNIKDFTYQNGTTAWTQTQINDLYYRNSVPSGAYQWRFNDAVTDQSGTNAMTLVGGSYVLDTPVNSRDLV